MLSKEILEAQDTVEMPARDMMRFTFIGFNNVSSVNALQLNASVQIGAGNYSEQGNAIVVTQLNGA